MRSIGGGGSGLIGSGMGRSDSIEGWNLECAVADSSDLTRRRHGFWSYN
jgi:hypothetical protein